MDLVTLRDRIREVDAGLDESAWPGELTALLTQAGCWSASVPARLGGQGAPPPRRVEVYEHVAAGSLSLALILTQHDGACELLADCDNQALAQELLPRFAKGELLTTVGISQLTTSRRGSGPAMRGRPDGDGFVISGVMPWVTSAPKADYVVTGAVLENGNQILACLPTRAAGMSVAEPMEFMALNSSWTSEIHCQDVKVRPGQLMRGPVEQVLAIRAPVKSLTVSAVAIGVAGALLEGVRERASTLGDDFQSIERQVVAQYDSARKRLYDAAARRSDPAAEVPAQEIRVAVNDLLIRLACTHLTLAKGSGYLSSRPSQKLLREAMFFLVWSAPKPVQMGTLAKLWESR